MSWQAQYQALFPDVTVGEGTNIGNFVLIRGGTRLVARIVRVGREMGCEAASPDEARAIIGLPDRVPGSAVGS